MRTSIHLGHAAFMLSGSDVVRPASGLVHRGGHEAQDAGYQTDDLCGAQVHILISFQRSIASLCYRTLAGRIQGCQEKLLQRGRDRLQEDDPVVGHAREGCGDQAAEGLLRVFEEAFFGHHCEALLLDADDDLPVLVEAQGMQDVVDGAGGVHRVPDDVVVKHGHRREPEVHRFALLVDLGGNEVHVVTDLYDALTLHGDGVTGQRQAPVIQTAPDIRASAGLVSAGVGRKLLKLLEGNLDFVQGHDEFLGLAGELEQVCRGLEDGCGGLVFGLVPEAAANAGAEAQREQEQDHAEGTEGFLYLFHGASPFCSPCGRSAAWGGVFMLRGSEPGREEHHDDVQGRDSEDSGQKQAHLLSLLSERLCCGLFCSSSLYRTRKRRIQGYREIF